MVIQIEILLPLVFAPFLPVHIPIWVGAFKSLDERSYFLCRLLLESGVGGIRFYWCPTTHQVGAGQPLVPLMRGGRIVAEQIRLRRETYQDGGFRPRELGVAVRRCRRAPRGQDLEPGREEERRNTRTDVIKGMWDGRGRQISHVSGMQIRRPLRGVNSKMKVRVLCYRRTQVVAARSRNGSKVLYLRFRRILFRSVT
jgi:hypothetical protein